jgi:DNA-binding GntR family transcriptional regulator
MHGRRATRPRCSSIAGSVTVIDQTQRLDDLVEELEASINLGILPPGAEVRIAEIAERYDLAARPLARRLHDMARGPLFDLDGEVIVVAAMDVDELLAAHRLHSVIRADLFDRSGGWFSPASLRKLALIIPDLATSAGGTHADGGCEALIPFGNAMVGLQRALCSPAASVTEFQILNEIQQSTRRFYSLGWAALYRADGSEGTFAARTQQHMLDRWREVLTLLQNGKFALARELLQQDADHSRSVGELSIGHGGPVSDARPMFGRAAG